MKPNPSFSLPRLIALLLSVLPSTLLGEPPTRHVVVVVWDGMRPDFVSEGATPALWKLAHEGVFFRRHHSVYPTATNVNGAVIATGVYPGRSGLLANREYRRRVNPRGPFENAAPAAIEAGDETSSGKYLAAPTVAEIMRSAGLHAAIAGTKSVALLHDRHAEWSIALSEKGFAIFAAEPMPRRLRDEMQQSLGPFRTAPADTSADRDAYTTRALTDFLWRDELPAFSLLWLSEPDLTQHETSPGSEASVAAIESSDRNLAAVLDALGKKKMRETTDVFVVSDHGFSTIERAIDFPAALRAAGFDAVNVFQAEPKAGQIMVVGNAGSILFYIIGHDREIAARLVAWLQHSDFAGVIFSREKLEGAFPLETAQLNNPETADVVVALRWNKTANRFGASGKIAADSARPPGDGSHASLSEFDVHNTLIAAGPDFRHGATDDLPTGNIDLAPTILRILHVEPPQKLDGRILSEAMTGKPPDARVSSETIEATREFPDGQWRQHLRLSRVGESTYLDEGNGVFSPKQNPPEPPRN
ncbi:MAG TPA: alkaline phosphatase family protein [Chthoniobacterales bacterium]